jgi:hypothetical protein
MLRDHLKRALRRGLTVLEGGANDTSPETPRVCEHCAHFDHAQGQATLRAHRPFAQVMQDLEPWQVGLTSRKFEPNPEYEALLEEQNRLMKDDPASPRLDEIAERLDLLNPRQVAEDQGVPEETLTLTWDDFGLCTKKREVLSKVDSCEAWTPRPKETP